MNVMKINMRRVTTQQDGITLLITLLLMGVLLAVSTSLLNITLKQYQLAGIAYSSEVAFQAASAGMECALYHDYISGDFGVGSERNEVECFGESSDDLEAEDDADLVESGNEQRFQFTWGEPEVCTEFSVYKFYDASAPVAVEVDGVNMRADCPAGATCTVVQSRGYNVACGDIVGSGRVVEREYTQVY